MLNTKDLRELSLVDLESKVKALRKDYFGLKMQKSTIILFTETM